MDNKVKIVAFHLPQFHTFPENDEWWGKGFTEWVNVKRAKPLFENHNQPRIPLENNYYDLSEDKVLLEQMKLAKKYGIDAFCFYHYWFDGKLLLEKPIEKLLRLEDSIDYFFCWANEPWTRSWDGKSKDIIMPQKYGGKEDWEKHFKYMLPFFKQDEYVKKDGCPILVIYRTNNIENCNEMVSYWDKRCKEEGFEGICLFEEYNSFQKSSYCKYTKAMIEFEPMNSLSNNTTILQKFLNYLRKIVRRKIKKSNLEIFDYDDIWKKILKQKHKSHIKETNLGAFVDWDNTPRKGNRGLVIQNACPEKFEKYLKLQIERAKKLNSEYIFINAWNEWGEGTYLEPDSKNKFEYLKAIQRCKCEEEKNN